MCPSRSICSTSGFCDGVILLNSHPSPEEQFEHTTRIRNELSYLDLSSPQIPKQHTCECVLAKKRFYRNDHDELEQEVVQSHMTSLSRTQSSPTSGSFPQPPSSSSAPYQKALQGEKKKKKKKSGSDIAHGECCDRASLTQIKRARSCVLNRSRRVTDKKNECESAFIINIPREKSVPRPPPEMTQDRLRVLAGIFPNMLAQFFSTCENLIRRVTSSCCRT